MNKDWIVNDLVCVWSVVVIIILMVKLMVK